MSTTLATLILDSKFGLTLEVTPEFWKAVYEKNQIDLSENEDRFERIAEQIITKVLADNFNSSTSTFELKNEKLIKEGITNLIEIHKTK